MNTLRLALAVSLVTAAFSPSLSAQTGPSEPVPTNDEVTRLSPFEVHEKTDSTSYRATESISASGVAMPIRDIPVPIQVITQSLLEDRGALDLFNASFLVSGLVTAGPILTGQESWLLHGYAAPALRDGFRLDNDTTDMAEVDRIEVATGPAAVLYGSGATGGAVNLITKKPSFVSEGKLLAGIGTYNFYQGKVDVTGPIPGLMKNGKPVLAYRAIASSTSNTSDIDWFKRTRNSFNGSLRFQPSDRVNFTVEVGSNQRHGRPSVEVPEGKDAGGATDFNKDSTGRGYQFSIAGPDSYDNMRGDNVQVMGDVHLTDGLLLHVDYLDHSSHLENLRARRIDLFGQGKPAQLDQQHEIVSQQLWKVNLLWDTQLGAAITNKLILSAEGSRDHDTGLFHRISDWVPPADFTITPAVMTELFSAKPYTNRDRTTYFRAYRASDFATMLNGRLHVLGSIRRDQPTYQKELVSNTYARLEGATTGQIGIVYDIIKPVSVFVNYSSDFVPNTALGPNNVTLDPQRGSGIEGGLKFALDAKLTGTVTLFSEERTNIPLRIGQTNSFQLSGKDRSRGVDFNFVYTPTPIWSFVLGGSFFDAKTIANTADPTQIGLPPQDVCPDSLNFQATFHGQGALTGFSAGVGGYWHIDYPTESSTSKRHERTDQAAILDGFLRYDFKIATHKAAVTLNVTNLTDKRAYIVNQEAFGPPRIARLLMSYEF